MLTILGFLLLGIIAGALARLLVPGRDPMGLLGTMLLGIVGSFVGGFLASLLLSGPNESLLQPSGFIGSILGAIVALLIYRAVASRSGSTAHR